MHKIIRAAAAAAALVGLVIASGAAPAGAAPNCVDYFAQNFDSAISNHGQHIVGDYVMGTGHTHDGAAWPWPGDVGATIGGSGASNPGAPGIQEHPFPPGASFCNGSNSPTSAPGRS
jgi:hypothetical protein